MILVKQRSHLSSRFDSAPPAPIFKNDILSKTKLVRHRYEKQDDQWVNFANWILEYDQYKYPDDFDFVSKLILDNLEPKYCPKKYRERNKDNPLFGYCYIVTQSLYYFFWDSDLTIMSSKCEIADAHWWLQDGEKILDLTADQYYNVGKSPPYKTGKEAKWYGWKNRPHKITMEFMKKVQDGSCLYHEKLTV